MSVVPYILCYKTVFTYQTNAKNLDSSSNMDQDFGIGLDGGNPSYSRIHITQIQTYLGPVVKASLA